MVTTHNDGGVVLWDLRSHTQTTALGAHDKDASCCGVLVGGAGEYVVSGGGDATVRVWDVRGGTTAKRLKGKRGGFEVERVETESPVMSLACDSARDGVASIGLMNGVMSVYDFSKLEVPERVGQWTTANDKGITCVRYSPDSSWILTAGINGQCAGWHTDSFEKVMERKRS
ncbi:WD40-repeat-containing domain protein [Chytriomyces sp. MP71]|nr:WD40-repeat-containing domain protein [Chytriomyces sp. MP71]